MSKILRKLQKQFGSVGAAAQFGKFGSFAAGTPETSKDPDDIQSFSEFLDGWFGAVVGANSPAIEDRNALDYLWAYQLGYLFQQGIAEWNTDTEYHVGSLVNDGLGNVYASIQNTNEGNLITDAAWWRNVSGTQVKVTAVNYQMTAGDKLVLASGVTTVTLPDATTVPGLFYEIKKTDAGAVTDIIIVDTLGETIDGNSSFILKMQNESVKLRSDGTNWRVISFLPSNLIAISSSCDAFTTSVGPIDITNLEIQFQANGRPILVGFTDDGALSGNPSSFSVTSSGGSFGVGQAFILRNGTEVLRSQIRSNVANETIEVPTSSISYVDPSPGFGLITYKAQARMVSGSNVAFQRSKMFVREI